MDCPKKRRHLKVLATGNQDGVVRFWKAATGERKGVFRYGKTHVVGLEFSPDGKLLAAVGISGPVKLLDAETVKERVALKEEFDVMGRSLAFSPDGKVLATGNVLGDVLLWDSASGRKLRKLHSFAEDLLDGLPQEAKVFFLPKDRRVVGVVGTPKKSAVAVKLWDVDTAKSTNVAVLEEVEDLRVVLSPDGTHLGALTTQKQRFVVRVWDVTSRKEVFVLPRVQDTIRRLAFSPDSKRLVTAGAKNEPNSGAVRIWNVSSGREEVVGFQGHKNVVMSVAFSPDGKTLATGSVDRTVKVWDAATGNELATLRGHESSLGIEVRFSPDGKTLATMGNYTVRLWDLAKVTNGP